MKLPKITLEQFKNYSLNDKFNFILAKKLEGYDISPEKDALSKDELIQFKEWISKKKEDAEEKIWKKKQADRAASSDMREEIKFNTGE